MSYIPTSGPSFLQHKESRISTLTTTEAQAVFFQGLGNIFQRRKLKNRIRPHPSFCFPVLLSNLLSSPAGLFTGTEHTLHSGAYLFPFLLGFSLLFFSQLNQITNAFSQLGLCGRTHHPERTCPTTSPDSTWHNKKGGFQAVRNIHERMA